MQTSPRFIVELQSVRGLAALVVVIDHAMGYFDATGPLQWVQSLANGHAAVVIFFILSGYVLTRSLAKISNVTDLMRWYGRRLFRIYPALWAASLLAIAYLAFLHWRVPIAGESGWIQHRFRADRWNAVCVIASLAGMLAFLLPQLWTITVELAGSLIMPVLQRIVARGVRPALAALAVLLVVSVLLGVRTYYGIAAYMLDFCIGVSLHLLPESFMRRLHPIRIPLALLALFMLIVPRMSYIGPLHGARPHLIELAAATVLIAGVIHHEIGGRFLRWKPIERLGDISYSVYLIHFPVMCIIAKAVGQLSAAGSTKNVLLCAATIIVTIPLSRLLYQYVEVPGIQIGKKVTGGAPTKPLAATF